MVLILKGNKMTHKIDSLGEKFLQLTTQVLPRGKNVLPHRNGLSVGYRTTDLRHRCHSTIQAETKITYSHI